MTDLFSLIVGLFCLVVWVEYRGSLVDDVARFLEKRLKEDTNGQSKI